MRKLSDALPAIILEGTNSEGLISLMRAAKNGHLYIVRCLASDYGTKIEATHAEGSSALMLAADSGHLDVVRCLAGDHGMPKVGRHS
jgi:hypothetical protein